jgi:hypothetical protein
MLKTMKMTKGCLWKLAKIVLLQLLSYWIFLSIFFVIVKTIYSYDNITPIDWVTEAHVQAQVETLRLLGASHTLFIQYLTFLKTFTIEIWFSLANNAYSFITGGLQLIYIDILIKNVLISVSYFIFSLSVGILWGKKSFYKTSISNSKEKTQIQKYLPLILFLLTIIGISLINLFYGSIHFRYTQKVAQIIVEIVLILIIGYLLVLGVKLLTIFIERKIITNRNFQKLPLFIRNSVNFTLLFLYIFCILFINRNISVYGIYNEYIIQTLHQIMWFYFCLVLITYWIWFLGNLIFNIIFRVEKQDNGSIQIISNSATTKTLQYLPWIYFFLGQFLLWILIGFLMLWTFDIQKLY